MKEIKTWKDLFCVCDEDIASATDKELGVLYDRVAGGKPGTSPMDKVWYGYYTEAQSEAIKNLYWMVVGERDKRYREENEDDVRKYFEKNFSGKTWEEIRGSEELMEKWGYYSDWHKDCFGYRPHGLVCGEYVNPHIA